MGRKGDRDRFPPYQIVNTRFVKPSKSRHGSLSMVNGRCLLGFLPAQLTILPHNCRAGILLNSEQLTPGWSAYLGVGPNTRQLTIDNRMSDINATVVWVQQNFYTWVEGERVFTGGWEPVSVRYPWHNSLRLERANPTANWIVAPSTRIQPGHMEFGSNPRTESQ
jgi:hypothetical protein